MSSAAFRGISVRAAALSAVALLALTGCSGGSDQDGTEQPTAASSSTQASGSATEESTAETEAQPVSF